MKIKYNSKNVFKLRYIKIFLLIIVLLPIFYFGVIKLKEYKFFVKNINAPSQLSAPKSELDLTNKDSSVNISDISTEIKIVAMGDMIPHDTIVNNAKDLNDYNFTKYFQYIRPMYSSADIVFCNQEGLSAGEAFGISGYPSFNAPKQFSRDLNKAGCNLINLANNHMGDKTVSAINTTIDVWNELKPLNFAGANKSQIDQNSVKYFNIKKVKFAFLAFADFNNNKNTPSYAVNIYHDKSLFDKLLKEARQNAEVVIVSMHWGTENSNSLNTDQKQQIEILASNNVDIVFGTGPHVLQKYESINRQDGKSMHVWYSLGNMLSSQLDIKELIGGIASLKIIKKNNEILIDSPTFLPTYMHYEWTLDDKLNNRLSARKNVMIYQLKDAQDQLSRSLFNTTVAEQMNYIKEILGIKVDII